VFGAVTSAVLHAFYFSLTGITSDFSSNVLPMLTGDFVGTIVVLYSLQALIRSWDRLAR
jgi:hypothetical protein